MLSSRSRRAPRIPTPEKPKDPHELSADDLSFDKQIGAGAYGDVFLGRVISTGETVAIKRLHVTTMSARSSEIFGREIATLASTQHRFVLPFVGYTKSAPFCIVTKYAVNGSLFSALHDNPRELSLGPTELSVIAYGIANGMAFLHSRDIVHRDLKPQNVLLDENLLPIIADFGSARSFANVEGGLTGAAGTSNYMAPEFIRGADYDEKVDVYSYGMLLYEMLMRETPFGDLEGPQVICAIVIHNSRPAIPSDAPDDVRELIEECWDNDPKMRPTFEEIAQRWETGIVSFEGSDYQVFTQKIQPKKRGYMGLKKMSTTILGSGNKLANPAMEVFRSSQKLVIPRVGVVKSEKMAKTYLDTLSEGSTAQIESALSYLGEHLGEDYMAGLPLWQRVLPLVVARMDDFGAKLEELVNSMCERPEILKGMLQIRDLHVYLCENSLNVFLYFVTFHTDAVTIDMVEKLSNMCASEKAIILLCKISEQSSDLDIVEKSYEVFKNVVDELAMKPGGHLVLQLLTNRREVENRTISLYLLSTIPQNIVAGYNALHAYGDSPNLLKMRTLLQHVCSESSDVRNCAMRFIKSFAVKLSGENLFMVVDALLQCAREYTCEQAILLLCRYASDPDCADVFVTKAASSLTSPAPKPVMIGMMKVVLVLFSHERLRFRLFSIPNLPMFFSLVLRTEVSGAVQAVCDILVRGDLSVGFIRALYDVGAIDFLCAYLQKTNHNETIMYLVAAISKIAKCGFLSVFCDAAARMLEIVPQRNSLLIHCLAGLAILSLRAEVCQRLRDDNASDILAQISEREAKPYLIRIYKNMHNL